MEERARMEEHLREREKLSAWGCWSAASRTTSTTR
jgi:hypothetical protein